MDIYFYNLDTVHHVRLLLVNILNSDPLSFSSPGLEEAWLLLWAYMLAVYK